MLEIINYFGEQIMNINKKRHMKSLITTLLLSATCSSLTYAATCDRDVEQMYAQIGQYESITSHDGHRFTAVYSPSDKGHNTCTALGYYAPNTHAHPEYICTIKWTKGDWGNTFSCI